VLAASCAQLATVVVVIVIVVGRSGDALDIPVAIVAATGSAGVDHIDHIPVAIGIGPVVLATAVHAGVGLLGLLLLLLLVGGKPDESGFGFGNVHSHHLQKREEIDALLGCFLQWGDLSLRVLLYTLMLLISSEWSETGDRTQ